MPLSIIRDEESFTVADRLPVLPLRDVVVFPYVIIPLLVGRAASLAAVDAASEDRWILLVAQRNGDVQDPAAADLFRIGVVARIVQLTRLPNGTSKVLVEGVARARVTRYSATRQYLRAAITPAPLSSTAQESGDRARGRRALSLFEEYAALHRRIPAEVIGIVQGLESEIQRAYAIAAHIQVGLEQRQELLEIPAVAGLVDQVAELLQGEIEILRLERKIEDDVRGTLFQNQREFYLQEQLKAIHRELGEDDGDDVAELAALISTKPLPEATRVRAERELRKLRRSSPLSPESSVPRPYL